MKGRRKAKSAKWKQISQFTQDARAILESDIFSQRRGRFLSRAEAAGRDAEPLGKLAGNVLQSRREAGHSEI